MSSDVQTIVGVLLREIIALRKTVAQCVTVTSREGAVNVIPSRAQRRHALMERQYLRESFDADGYVRRCLEDEMEGVFYAACW